MAKSFVGMTYTQCPACGTVTADAVLLHKRVRPVFDDSKKLVTGFKLCPAHQQLADEGYVALVEIDPAQSTQPFTPFTAFRTGKVGHIRREKFPKLFNVPLTDDTPMVYVEPGILDALEEEYKKQQE